MQSTTNNIHEALFVLVFISQFLLISWYCPRKIVARIKTVIKKYPPSEYPMLYIEPVEYYHAKLDKFKDLVSLSLITCLLILMVSWSMGNSINEEMLVLLSFIVQTIPLFVLVYTVTKHQSLMKKAYFENKQTVTRTADLKPRRLFDFVSAKLVAVAAILYTAFILIYLTIHDFNIFSKPDEVLGTLVGMTLMQVFFIAMIYWQMHGKKKNPYLDDTDRLKEIKAVAKIAAYTSIAASIVLIVSTVMDEFKYLDSLDPLVMSLYFQVITTFAIGTEMRSKEIEQMNFDVYKQENETEIAKV